MTKVIILSLCLLYGKAPYCQGLSNQYLQLTRQADSLFSLENFEFSVNLYTKAFTSNGNNAKVIHRYKAASCWARLGNSDSAFFQLNRIATKGKFSRIELLSADINFFSLHSDIRWKPLLKLVEDNGD